jgi:hypothetical protein
MVAMPRRPIREGVVGDQHAAVRAHRHFPPQDLFVVFAANRGHRDVAAARRRSASASSTA